MISMMMTIVIIVVQLPGAEKKVGASFCVPNSNGEFASPTGSGAEQPPAIESFHRRDSSSRPLCI